MAVLMLLFGTSLHADILYVKANAPAGGNGSSWANAMNSLGDALFEAEMKPSVTEIWVAQGTYYPTDPFPDVIISGRAPDNRDNTFPLLKNVKIYGGFPNTGNPGMADRIAPSLRNLSQSSVLSGDINKDGTWAGNALQVVSAIGDVGNAVLDGFVITGGYGQNGNCKYTLTGTDLNWWPDDGGGIQVVCSSPTLSNLIFTNNVAYSGASIFITGRYYPGGVESLYTIIPEPKVTNCLFVNNLVQQGGSAIKSRDTNVKITNVTISGNGMTAGEIEAHPTERRSTIYFEFVLFSPAVPEINNALIYGDLRQEFVGDIVHFHDQGSVRIINNSLIQGLVENEKFAPYGTGNIFGDVPDPLFTAPSNLDFTLKSGSPAINAGSNAKYNGSNKDLAGNPRIYGGTIDMGAYESQTGSGTVIDKIHNVENAMVYVSDNVLTVNAKIAVALGVYDLTGKTILEKDVVAGITKIPLQKGVYVVNVDGKSVKVISY